MPGRPTSSRIAAGCSGAGRGEAGDAVGRDVHAETLPGEVHAQQVGDGALVLDDENEPAGAVGGHGTRVSDAIGVKTPPTGLPAISIASIPC